MENRKFPFHVVKGAAGERTRWLTKDGNWSFDREAAQPFDTYAEASAKCSELWKPDDPSYVWSPPRHERERASR